MTDKDDIELFDSYQAGRLDKNSSDAFEQKLATDSNFRDYFNNYTTAKRVIKTAAVGLEVRLLMINQTSREVRVRYITRLSIAASVVLATSFYIWFLNRPSGDQLFETYFQPYPNILTARSATEDPVAAALDHYTAGRFAEAIQLLEQVSAKSDTLYFYSGVSSLSIRNPGDAILYLGSIDEDSPFRQQVKWYLGLAYLLQGEHDLAREKFMKIGPKEFKYKEAQNILASL